MPRIGALALATAALLASGARAEQRSSDDLAAARAYAREGLALYQLGKYQEAVSQLELAYQKKPVPALLFNIAQCHRQLGHFEETARLCKLVLRSHPSRRVGHKTRKLLGVVEEELARQHRGGQAPPAGL